MQGPMPPLSRLPSAVLLSRHLDMILRPNFPLRSRNWYSEITLYWIPSLFGRGGLLGPMSTELLRKSCSFDCFLVDGNCVDIWTAFDFAVGLGGVRILVCRESCIETEFDFVGVGIFVGLRAAFNIGLGEAFECWLRTELEVGVANVGILESLAGVDIGVATVGIQEGGGCLRGDE
mmetsp:Transcript_15296/g.37607  ORF Transcript_15296/g.37607 Transcript_15296/m.37607 type:complete len:176 (-) Transcript_15296:345-872(-)